MKDGTQVTPSQEFDPTVSVVMPQGIRPHLDIKLSQPVYNSSYMRYDNSHPN
jgi:hypothetical protein